MAFNNRWICKYDENISFQQIQKLIKETDYFEDTTSLNTLKHKIELYDHCEIGQFKFIYGRYAYEYETKASSPEITKEKIIDIGDIKVVPKVVTFWISDNNLIIFSLKDEKSKLNFSENILNSEKDIQNIRININKIHQDVEDGKLREMWTSSFKARESNVNKGTLYGVDVNQDPIFNETSEAIQSNVGVIVDVGDEQVKIKLTHDGLLQIYGPQLKLDDVLMFKLIDKLKDYFQ